MNVQLLQLTLSTGFVLTWLQSRHKFLATLIIDGVSVIQVAVANVLRVLLPFFLFLHLSLGINLLWLVVDDAPVRRTKRWWRIERRVAARFIHRALPHCVFCQRSLLQRQLGYLFHLIVVPKLFWCWIRFISLPTRLIWIMWNLVEFQIFTGCLTWGPLYSWTWSLDTLTFALLRWDWFTLHCLLLSITGKRVSSRDCVWVRWWLGWRSILRSWDLLWIRLSICIFFILIIITWVLVRPACFLWLFWVVCVISEATIIESKCKTFTSLRICSWLGYLAPQIQVRNVIGHHSSRSRGTWLNHDLIHVLYLWYLYLLLAIFARRTSAANILRLVWTVSSATAAHQCSIESELKTFVRFPRADWCFILGSYLNPCKSFLQLAWTIQNRAAALNLLLSDLSSLWLLDFMVRRHWVVHLRCWGLICLAYWGWHSSVETAFLFYVESSPSFLLGLNYFCYWVKILI